MRILHISHSGLPDARVERTALTGKKNGHTVYFAGRYIRGKALPIKLFDEYFFLPFNKYSNTKIPFFWKRLKKNFTFIIEKIRPDFIHAHDIVAAKLASEYVIPIIYDDHEYWSKQTKLDLNFWKINKLYVNSLYTRWEKEILRKSTATITVSTAIAKEHNKICKSVYVTQNFPSRIETKNLILNLKENLRLSSVYVGPDFSKSLSHKSMPHRNVEGYLDIFNNDDVGRLTVIGDPELQSSKNVCSLGYLSHDKLMKELSKHHIGLLPRRQHWYHKYSNPNKAYEYAHAGLLVIASSDFINLKEYLNEFCIQFTNKVELKKILEYYSNNLRKIVDKKAEIRKYAFDKLSWENMCESNILKAYDLI